ncbi:pyridoxamine 5'-phosphate oxidase family protein [Pseudonocardia asaccharolytica]|uniref:Pyridoxamine 5'-phosphate oxidase n=1 Tax=Pseudonocardia asaccharolytica DSM 44247 = NBRC 16224 TaxID=1123024 RepID=A0A511D012_9PSEU|nr:pyridoxamine 5'-phosphate oxidase family protein [Pseudonocardia asaccharolytica]GEL18129.1 pyridoxamine 5'-phosphate oxidase [Pseudonocardia asaccharolytica DSM 44247 = NBRC 16224]
MTLPDPDTVAPAVELVSLDRAECLSLLLKGRVGRVVFTEAAMPAAHPVNYVLDGEEVLFRTADGRTLAATDRAVIAFEIDELDPVRRIGWSVLGVGQAYEVTDPDRLAALDQRAPVPWAPARAAHLVAIPLQRLTGRRLRLLPNGAPRR